MRRTALLVLSVLVCIGEARGQTVTRPGDLPGPAPFPQAEVVDVRHSSVIDRLYPQGALQRIAGRVRMDAQVVASGELTAVTYQLPKAHEGIEAFTRARLELLAAGAAPLYWCEGRDCGSSSLWANEVFGRALLYGPENRQAYLLARQPDHEALLALYAVTRGNGRAYLHVEQLLPSAPLGDILPSPATLLRLLHETGELRLPGLPDAPSTTWHELLTRVLQLDSALRVSLAGRSAEAWRDALVARGVRGERLEAEPNDQAGLRLRLLR